MSWFGAGSWWWALTAWVRQKMVRAVVINWLRYWLLTRPEVFLRHLRSFGFPGEYGPDLFVGLSVQQQREEFHAAIVAALEETIKEATAKA